MSLVKICGMMRNCDIEYANRYKPDFIGFILSPGFRRSITAEKAAGFKKQLNGSIKAVGVFVNSEPEYISQLCSESIIDIIQLHGDEDEEYINRLKKLTDKKIIKAVHVKTKADIINADKLPCDYLLLDTYQKGAYGGIGEAFNWDIIPKEIGKPFFLAGGLNSENIEQAVRQVNPFAVDLSSGAETEGKKDEEKIKAIIESIRRIR